MKSITILFFASLRDITGERQIKKIVSPDINIAELKEILMQDYPGLNKYINAMIVSLNHEFADNDVSIPDGAEIAIFPPVSGGSS